MVYAKEIKTSKKRKVFKAAIYVLIASIIMSINIKIFVNAGHLIPGGLSGLAILLQRVFKTYMHIAVPYSIINIALNAVPAYIGFKTIGKRFTLFSVFYIVISSIIVDFIPNMTITYDPLLISVFGGILSGVSILIALLGGASTGGTDFVAVYLSEKLNGSSWSVVLAINSIIILVAGLLFGFEAALYSIIYQYVSTQIIERFHKSKQRSTLMIVTDKANLLEEEIMNYTHHTITRFYGAGGYTKEEKIVLYVVLSTDEVDDVIRLCKELDPNSFINVMKSTRVSGKFYSAPIE